MSDEFIVIGKILKTQGNRGAVRVLPLTDFPERFKELEKINVSIKGGRLIMDIEEAMPHQKYIVVKFKDINDMNAAEAIKGGVLEITRAQLTPLPEGSYYIFDIVGLSVYGSGGERFGEITEVLQTGANDVYIVDTGGKPLLIPALRQVVKEIDLTGRRMVVDLPEGLMDNEN
ncbi:MAG: ribosome maturation factor RimM [Desulfotomaculaceae bacterium]